MAVSDLLGRRGGGTRAPAPARQPELPSPRGPLSAAVVRALDRVPSALRPVPVVDDPLTGDDFHLALACCYELHYRGFAGVDPDWEWNPHLLAFCRRLEAAFADALRQELGPDRTRPDLVPERLVRLTGEADLAALPAWLAAHGTADQLRELAVARSAFHLKEADPHTLVLPRLDGLAKAAAVEIQTDEYGHGVPGASHAELYALLLEELGLDPRPLAYLDVIPGAALALGNLATMLCLHRRWRGAALGHLAACELVAPEPMRRCSEVVAAFSFGPLAQRFFDVHVAIDARHQQIAVHEMVAGLLADEPALAGDVCFGARAMIDVEMRCARHLVKRWHSGRSALLGAGPPG